VRGGFRLVHRSKRLNPSVEQLHTPSHTTLVSYLHAYLYTKYVYVLAFEWWGYRGRVPIPSANIICTTALCVSCACVMRVRISWVYLCVRVCCRRFGEGFVIRGFVIFQFLCIPWGTAKSRQTVCAELARDAVVCPSLSPTSPDVCIAYNMYRDSTAARSSSSFEATLDVSREGGGRGEIFV